MSNRRKASSRRWLDRQHSDPYVREAQRQGWRSRAAFKLLELDDRFHFLQPGDHVVDLGAAPGGWTQVAVDRVRAKQAGGGRVLAIDLKEMAEVTGARFIQLDALAPETPDVVREALGGRVDVLLSDMAAPATGHRSTDHLRVVTLCEIALLLAEDVLASGGTLVCKVLQGGTEASLLAEIKLCFDRVRHAKPPASRSDSAEIYLVATGYQGRDDDDEDIEGTGIHPSAWLD
jgi:23S rRNA (uridine2552-2'-O)-methyltransferase